MRVFGASVVPAGTMEKIFAASRSDKRWFWTHTFIRKET